MMKYSLHNYKIYADTIFQIMNKSLYVNKNGYLYLDSNISLDDKKSVDVDIVAYHHWLNNDDLNELYKKHNICEKDIKYLLNK